MLEIDKIVRKLHRAQEQLVLEIMMTPTSPTRNRLCDANLHTMMALRELRKLQAITGNDEPAVQVQP